MFKFVDGFKGVVASVINGDVVNFKKSFCCVLRTHLIFLIFDIRPSCLYWFVIISNPGIDCFNLCWLCCLRVSFYQTNLAGGCALTSILHWTSGAPAWTEMLYTPFSSVRFMKCSSLSKKLCYKITSYELNEGQLPNIRTYLVLLLTWCKSLTTQVYSPWSPRVALFIVNNW